MYHATNQNFNKMFVDKTKSWYFLNEPLNGEQILIKTENKYFQLVWWGLICINRRWFWYLSNYFFHPKINFHATTINIAWTYEINFSFDPSSAHRRIRRQFPVSDVLDFLKQRCKIKILLHKLPKYAFKIFSNAT